MATGKRRESLLLGKRGLGARQISVSQWPHRKKPILSIVSLSGCVHTGVAAFRDQAAAEDFIEALIEIFVAHGVQVQELDDEPDPPPCKTLS